MEIAILVFLMLFVVIGSAICSGTERAFSTYSGNEIRVMNLRDSKNRREQVLYSIMKDSDSLDDAIDALLIINNAVNILGTSLVTAVTGIFFSSFWVAMVPVILLVAIIVLGESYPKALGNVYFEKWSLRLAAPTCWFMKKFRVLIIVLDFITPKFFLKKKKQEKDWDKVIIDTAGVMRRNGKLDDEEADIIDGVLTLDKKTVAFIGTPRPLIRTLPANATLGGIMLDDDNVEKKVIDVIASSPHTRFVVIKGHGDSYHDVVAIVRKDELAFQYIKGEKDVPISELSICREPIFIPHDTKVDELFKQFRIRKSEVKQYLDGTKQLKPHQELRIFYDENGVFGIVTQEDVLEEFVGELVDETDKSIDPRAQYRERIKKEKQAQQNQ